MIVARALTEDGRMLLAFKLPKECRRCHTMHYFFVNHGETLCLDCHSATCVMCPVGKVDKP